MQHLAGRSAVVTGSSMGIGKAVALELARHGASVVLNSSSSAVALEETVAEITDAGGRVIGRLGSVADYDFAGSLVADCVREFGAIDILVNVAGIAEPPGSSILDIDPADWRRQIDVHLHGTFNTCRHAAPLMAARKRGVIVNTASHALLGVFGGTGYAAGKGGTLSLSWAMARELAGHGVRCNVVCPGAESRLSTGPEYATLIASLNARGILDDRMRDAALNPVPAKFLAPAYAFLASDLARDVNGKLFSVAGGYVGLFTGLQEQFLAYKDHRGGETWTLEELAAQLAGALTAPGTLPR